MGETRPVKVRFTHRAARNLDEILDYIEARSPQGAAHVFDRMEAMLATLAERPEIGVTVPGTTFRRFVVAPYPYLIFYRVTAEAVIIHRIRHAARRPSS
jgi:addiction module RelE/StbE family toxin